MSLDDRLNRMSEELDREIPVPVSLKLRLNQLKHQGQARTRPGWWSKLFQRPVTVTVGAALVAVLVSIPLLRNQVAPPSGLEPQAPVKTPPIHGTPLVALDMVTDKAGWALNGDTVLRTMNGGLSWESVPPPGFGYDPRLVTHFADEKTAWIAVWNEKTKKPTVFRTQNGGETWPSADVPLEFGGGQNFPASIAFIDSKQGWLMVVPEHGMNSSPGHLFATSDGGATWTEIASVQNKTLPFGGRISFRSASEGWLVGVPYSTTERLLYKTQDGGRTWKEQKLALPPELSDGKLDVVSPPTFFSAPDGVMEVTFVPNSHKTAEFANIIYVTHDGGNTWRSSKPLRQGPISFIGANEGWAWAAEPRQSESSAPVKGNLQQTHDGGQTWVDVTPDATLKGILETGANIVSLDFVSSAVGYALLRSPDGTMQAMKSNDGGKTWISSDTTFQLKR